MQVAREKPQFAEITVTTESSSTAATLLALFVKNVKPDAITIGWRPPSDSYVDIQMYEVGHVMHGRSLILLLPVAGVGPRRRSRVAPSFAIFGFVSKLKSCFFTV
jgi:hypothetical protein